MQGSGLSSHIIICGATESFVSFVQQLRKCDPISTPIVVLHPELPKAVWPQLKAHGPMHFVQASGASSAHSTRITAVSSCVSHLPTVLLDTSDQCKVEVSLICSLVAAGLLLSSVLACMYVCFGQIVLSTIVTFCMGHVPSCLAAAMLGMQRAALVEVIAYCVRPCKYLIVCACLPVRLCVAQGKPSDAASLQKASASQARALVFLAHAHRPHRVSKQPCK